MPGFSPVPELVASEELTQVGRERAGPGAGLGCADQTPPSMLITAMRLGVGPTGTLRAAPASRSRERGECTFSMRRVKSLLPRQAGGVCARGPQSNRLRRLPWRSV